MPGPRRRIQWRPLAMAAGMWLGAVVMLWGVDLRAGPPTVRWWQFLLGAGLMVGATVGPDLLERVRRRRDRRVVERLLEVVGRTTVAGPVSWTGAPVEEEEDAVVEGLHGDFWHFTCPGCQRLVPAEEVPPGVIHLCPCGLASRRPT